MPVAQTPQLLWHNVSPVATRQAQPCHRASPRTHLGIFLFSHAQPRVLSFAHCLCHEWRIGSMSLVNVTRKGLLDLGWRWLRLIVLWRRQACKPNVVRRPHPSDNVSSRHGNLGTLSRSEDPPTRSTHATAPQCWVGGKRARCSMGAAARESDQRLCCLSDVRDPRWLPWLRTGVRQAADL